MQYYEDKLKQYIEKNNIKAQQIIFTGEVKTSKASKVQTDNADIVKTVVFVDLDKDEKEGNGVVAIIPGEARVSKEKLRKITNSRVKIASAEQVLKLTTYPAGGVPPFGFKARFYLDKSLIKKDIVYAGGGSERTLIKTTIQEVLKANKAEIANILE